MSVEQFRVLQLGGGGEGAACLLVTLQSLLGLVTSHAGNGEWNCLMPVGGVRCSGVWCGSIVDGALAQVRLWWL